MTSQGVLIGACTETAHKDCVRVDQFGTNNLKHVPFRCLQWEVVVGSPNGAPMVSQAVTFTSTIPAEAHLG